MASTPPSPSRPAAPAVGAGHASLLDAPAVYPPLFPLFPANSARAYMGGSSGTAHAPLASMPSADQSGSALLGHAHVTLDLNPAYVIENPREPRESFLSGLWSSKKKAPPPPQPVALTPLPEVTRKDFEPYLAQLQAARARVGLSEAEFAAGMAAAAAFGADSAPQAARVATVAGASTHSAAEVVHADARTHASSGGSDSAALQQADAGMEGGGESPSSSLPATVPNAFSLVPSIFFDPAFETHRSRVLSDYIAQAPLPVVQSQLSEYFTIVETQLLALIRSRSRQFFTALQQLQELRNCVANTQSRVQRVQAMVKSYNRESAIQPLHIITASRRAARRRQAYSMLCSLRDAAASTSDVERLLAADSVLPALAVWTQLQTVLDTKLVGLAAAAALRARLTAAASRMAATLQQQFLAHATRVVVHNSCQAATRSRSDGGSATPIMQLQAFLSSSAANGSGDRDVRATAIVTTERSLADMLSQDMQPLCVGLLQLRALEPALSALESALIASLRELVKRTEATSVQRLEAENGGAGTEMSMSVQASGGDALSHDASSSGVSQEALEALAPVQFLTVLDACAEQLLDALHRLHALHELIEQVLDAQHNVHPAAAAAPALGTGDSVAASKAAVYDAAGWRIQVGHMRAMSSGILGACVDAAQRHLAKLLAARRQVSARFKVADVKQLWERASHFTVATRALIAHAGVLTTPTALRSSGSGATPTSGATLALGGGSYMPSPTTEECLLQARTMLDASHTRNCETLQAMLEAEQWRQADVPRQVQAVADAIVASVSFTPGAAVLQAAAANSDAVAISATAGHEEAEAAALNAQLVVKGQSYRVVPSGVMLVKMLGEYSGLAEALPDCATDVISATVELLRLFNTRAQQLVLGAGALALGQLKRVTAKHLAMTMQTLGALLALLPAIRGALIMRLPPSQHVLLQELARVTADFMQHEQRLLLKLVTIVKELFIKCCADMQALPWAEADAPSVLAPTAPMRELTRGIATLYKILAPILRDDQLQDCFTRIASTIASQCPVQYAAILSHTAAQVAMNPHAKRLTHERLLADVRVLIACLQELVAAASCATAANAGGTPPDAEAHAQVGRDAVAKIEAWAQRAFHPDAVTSAASLVSSPSSIVRVHTPTLMTSAEGGGDGAAGDGSGTPALAALAAGTDVGELAPTHDAALAVDVEADADAERVLTALGGMHVLSDTPAAAATADSGEHVAAPPASST